MENKQYFLNRGNIFSTLTSYTSNSKKLYEQLSISCGLRAVLVKSTQFIRNGIKTNWVTMNLLILRVYVSLGVVAAVFYIYIWCWCWCMYSITWYWTRTRIRDAAKSIYIYVKEFGKFGPAIYMVVKMNLWLFSVGQTLWRISVYIFRSVWAGIRVFCLMLENEMDLLVYRCLRVFGLVWIDRGCDSI